MRGARAYELAWGGFTNSDAAAEFVASSRWDDRRIAALGVSSLSTLAAISSALLRALLLVEPLDAMTKVGARRVRADDGSGDECESARRSIRHRRLFARIQRVR